MGMGGISIWQLLIVLAIVLLLFGGKRLRNLGGDLGTAIKGFKNSVKDDTKQIAQEEQAPIDVTSEAKSEASSDDNKS